MPMEMTPRMQMKLRVKVMAMIGTLQVVLIAFIQSNNFIVVKKSPTKVVFF
jgi:hypothetical protein